MKTHIVSCHVNASFLALQHKSLNKYFKGEYEFHVFDDSRSRAHACSYNEVHTRTIQELCTQLGIQYHRIPPDVHNHRNTILPMCGPTKSDHPVARCAVAVQYAFNWIVAHEPDGYFMLLDSDMFLIRSIDMNVVMRNKHILGVSQSRSKISYLWNALFICDLTQCPQLEDFCWEASRVYVLDETLQKTDESYGCDVGGHNYYYLKTHGYHGANKHLLTATSAYVVRNMESIPSDTTMPPELLQLCEQLSNIPSPPSPLSGYLNKEFLLNNSIIHIRGGGGWCYHKKEYHRQCVDIIGQFIEST